jgi:ABC-type microcin C transport system permease subunit YejE
LAGFVAVGLMWVEVARVVRGQVISVKEMQYVTAARALGFGISIILIISHLIMAPVIVISAFISYISGKRFKLSGFSAQPYQLGSIKGSLQLYYTR